MSKWRYVVKAMALYKVYRSYQLSKDDLDKADEMSSNLKEKAEGFKLLINMAKDTVAGRYKMNKWSMSVIIGTIVYVVSPLDAIPDVVPVLGWLDDVTIVTYALTKLKDEVLRYRTGNKPIRFPKTL